MLSSGLAVAAERVWGSSLGSAANFPGAPPLSFSPLGNELGDLGVLSGLTFGDSISHPQGSPRFREHSAYLGNPSGALARKPRERESWNQFVPSHAVFKETMCASSSSCAFSMAFKAFLDPSRSPALASISDFPPVPTLCSSHSGTLWSSLQSTVHIHSSGLFHVLFSQAKMPLAHSPVGL